MTKQKHFYLLRGLVRESGHWGLFLDHLRQAFPSARLTFLDLPGTGEHHLTTTPCTVQGMVDLMRKKFLQQQQIDEEAILIAISLGAMVSTEWMMKHPQDFSCGFFINTSFGKISPFWQRLKIQAWPHLIQVLWLRSEKRESHILKLVCNHSDDYQEKVTRYAKIAQERPVTFRNAFRQILAAILFRPKSKLVTPIYLLASTHDRMVSVECSRKLGQEWGLPIVEHPTAGHELTDDDPAWVVRELEKVLKCSAN